MPDVEIPCVQCKETFVFSEKEQGALLPAQYDDAAAVREMPLKKGRDPARRPARFEIVCDHCGRHDTVPFQPKDRAVGAV